MFTDIEGSTQLVQQLLDEYAALLADQRSILRTAFEKWNGYEVDTQGDAFFVAYTRASDAVNAAVDAQRSFAGYRGPQGVKVCVRMGLHTAESHFGATGYVGIDVHRAARICAAGHGGQVLLSQTTYDLLESSLPQGVGWRDLGEHRLKDLNRPQRLYQLEISDLPSDFPPLKSFDVFPNNLPNQITSFIGREREMAEIKDLLFKTHLLTLTGAGGSGKTRLAEQVATELLERFADGVWLAELSPLADSTYVVPAISSAVGYREATDRPIIDALIDYLHPKKLLLLLDNCEHLITPCVELVNRLLQSCPQLKVLVTSREALYVRGEYLYPVPPLGLPRTNLEKITVDQVGRYEAVRLFVERAQAVRSGFMLTDENLTAVVDVCLRLDGLPLAIELAAARVRVFSPQKLQARLESRLKLLRGGARDLPIRQQTLRSTIEWSYELLDEGEQRLFALLSVFSSSTFEAIEEVAGRITSLDDSGIETYDGLDSLLGKSLIHQVEPDDQEPRLLMLETIREYASERLSEDPGFSAEVQRAHASYFADFAQQQWQRLAGNSRKQALAEMASEADNLQTAWRYWVEKRDLKQLHKLVDSLWHFYDARGRYHATVDLTTELLDVLSSTPSTPERSQQEILLRIGLARALLAIKGYTSEAEEAYKQALELCETQGEIPQLFPVLRGLSTFYNYRAEFDKGAEIGEKILRLAENLDDNNIRVAGHLVLGSNLAFLDQIKLGLSHIDKGLAYYNTGEQPSQRFQLGNDQGVVCCTTSAFLLWVLGYPDSAVERANEGLALSRKINHPLSKAYAFYHAGFLHLWLRDPDMVRKRAREALEIAEEHDFQIWRALATCLDGVAMTAMHQGDQGLARFREGKALYQGVKSPPVFWPAVLFMEAGACALAGKVEEGLTILDEVTGMTSGGYGGVMLVADTLSLKGDLFLASSPSNSNKAEACYQQAINIARPVEARMLELRAAIRLSRLWRDQGKADRAAQLLSGVYQTFNEGFAAADLMEAKALLDELS
jgi:predicted ATPase/class 3 adenylate cyclase